MNPADGHSKEKGFKMKMQSRPGAIPSNLDQVFKSAVLPRSLSNLWGKGSWKKSVEKVI